MARIDMALLSPAAQRVIAVIRECGGRPMLTGGFIREALLGHTARPKDTDMEAYGITDPDNLAYPLVEAGFHVMESGRQFGVLKILADGEDIDVSLPRRESAFGAGHRGFTVIPDGNLGFAEAARRRDFTINALMADPETGEVLDFHGGLADLEAGILRHTSPAFAEDPLRVLRAMQFAARYGFMLDAETAVLCAWLLPRARELSVERVWGEFAKLVTRGTHISRGLAVLAQTGWVHLWPELAALRWIEQDPRWHPEGDVWVHAGLAADQAARLADEADLTGDDRMVVVLAALCHDFGKVTTTACDVRTRRIISHRHAEEGVAPTRSFLRRIGAPGWLFPRVEHLVREHMNCSVPPTKPAVRRMARRLEPASLAELALVISADARGRGDPDAGHALIGAWLDMARNLTVSAKPAKGILRGQHLIDSGMAPGPAFRPVLEAALAAQDAGEFTDEAGALAWLAARQRAEVQAGRHPRGPAGTEQEK